MFISDAELDFHEFGPMTEYDIEERLVNFLEDEHASGSKNLLVITGKGNVVRPLVEKMLRVNKFVESFKRAGYYNGQGGAFEVRLRE